MGRVVLSLFTFALLLTMLIPFAMMDTAYASVVIYGMAHSGSTGPSTFYTINPLTGTATAVGPVGFNRCSAMDFDTDNTLIGACSRSDTTPVLISINLLTGAGTEIGPTTLHAQIADMSLHPDGTMFGYDAENTGSNHDLVTFNTNTGTGTVIGTGTGLGSDGGNGLDANFGTIFHIFRDQGLRAISPITGLDLGALGAMTYSDTSQNKIKAMDTDTTTLTTWGISGGSNPERLVTIDFTFRMVTDVGLTASGMDAIAVVNDVPVGGTDITINTASLLLAGVQSVSMWMIPVVIAGIGVGVFVIKRKK